MSLLVFAVVLAMVIPALPSTSPDEIAIRKVLQDEIAAWNSGDAVAFSRHFAIDGTFTNIRGEYFAGRDAFIQQHAFIFQGLYHGSTLGLDVVSLRFLSPEVATVEVLTSVTGYQKLFPGMSADSKGRLRTRLLQVMVKVAGEWQIAAYQNTDVKSDVPVPDPQ